MPRFVPVEELFKGRHFDQEIVVLCVRWYLSFKLRYRDLVAIMGERGIFLAHSTILRWVQHYTPEFEKRWRRYARPVGGSGGHLWGAPLPYPVFFAPAEAIHETHLRSVDTPLCCLVYTRPCRGFKALAIA